MDSLFAPLQFRSGPTMPNRFMLAPLTNQQSNDDGTLSDSEYRFLTMRAEGGFGSVMTCGVHVEAIGKGFAGQLGIFGDQHIEGLTRLAKGINDQGSLSIAQLYHAGNRSSIELTGAKPVSASGSEEARAMTLEEIEESVSAFARAAVRAQTAGFSGVEIHGAHGYLISQFLSPELNQRDDRYGGSLENRSRFLYEILVAIDAATRDDFVLGVRLSPERFGMVMSEILEIAGSLLSDSRVDFLDMSLWDCFKEPNEEEHAGKSLAKHFADLPRDGVALGFAGKINQPSDAKAVMDVGADFILLGRSAILNHDFPNRLAADPGFVAKEAPASIDYLHEQGLSDKFIKYMGNWPGFVAEADADADAEE